MGGKSSSSSSSSTQQIDKRIAASESATVLQDLSGNTITVTDQGAVQGIADVANKAIGLAGANLDDLYEFGQGILDLLSKDHTATLDAMQQNSTQALSFVDKATQDSNARTFDQIAPWLVVGVSVIAISYAWRK